jgi:hypothetical protein
MEDVRAIRHLLATEIKSDNPQGLVMARQLLAVGCQPHETAGPLQRDQLNASRRAADLARSAFGRLA